MSQENARLVRAIFDSWNERGIEGMLQLFHDDIEYLPMEEDDTIRGHDGMRKYFERWMESWDDLHVAPTELLHGADRVFNGAAITGRGRGSGIEVAMEYWQVWTIRNGKAARWEEYLERKPALEAAGLRE